jgi:hypothetical protein
VIIQHQMSNLAQADKCPSELKMLINIPYNSEPDRFLGHAQRQHKHLRIEMLDTYRVRVWAYVELHLSNMFRILERDI